MRIRDLLDSAVTVARELSTPASVARLDSNYDPSTSRFGFHRE
jgi:hypothetical protein